MMFWLKNFRMSGMQLANTRCWAMYSNYETEDIRWFLQSLIRANKQEVAFVFLKNGGVRRPYLVDVVEFEVFQEQQQDGRDGLHDDLFVSIDIHAKFHALQHCGPAQSRLEA